MSSFLQSKTWERFQQAAGADTFRVDGVLFIKKKLFLGKSYLYSPRPDTACSWEKIGELAKKERAVFVRWEPGEALNIEKFPLKIVRSADVQPSKTVMVDLTKPEEKLLQSMHPKTRYNIRLAQKKGVEVRDINLDEYESFWTLMRETTERDGFRAHGKDYYKAMVETCKDAKSNDMHVRLYGAYHSGRLLAAGIFAFYEGMMTYVHGASSNEHRNVMAPYLLHWEVIREGKRKGYRQYDLYGIDEKRWPGVTRFKHGFGGREVCYPGVYDIVFNTAWYALYTLVRKVRRVIHI